MKWRLALAALAVAAVSGTASAHEVGLSYGQYKVEGIALRAELSFAEKELMILADGLDADRDGHASASEIAAAKPALEEALVRPLSVRVGTSSCAGHLLEARRVEGDGIQVDAEYRCPAMPSEAVVEVGLTFLEKVTPGHRHLVRASGGGSSIERIALKAEPSFKIPVSGSAEAAEDQSLSGLFFLGIEHILSGLDHLLFLVGLLLVGGRLRSLLAVITAFTVAHSITLGLALLGVFSLSPSFVEPAIALSVAYVAVENWFVKDASKRWRLTFAFGLLHGFGFAGALGRLSVPRAEVPAALLLFNLGVEAGQLIVLAVVLPAIFLARRRPWFRVTGVRILSGFIALIAIYWFVTRVISG
ncbi:MAG: HupE/UreJ family protein [Myxococcota bacterium]